MNVGARLNDPPIRLAFVLVTATVAVLLFVGQREEIIAATRQVGFATLGLAFGFALVNLLLAAASWRVVVMDLDLRITPVDAAKIYFLSQAGKYLPGGFWNFVAAAELGRDAGLTRTATMASLVLALSIGLISGAALALALLPISGVAPGQQQFSLLVAVAGPALLLVPRVRGRLLTLARLHSETRGSVGGTLLALALAIVGWFAAGLQIWFLIGEIGTTGSDPSDLPLAIGGYALAWVTGFLVLIAPAGLGAREATLTVTLASVVTPAEALVIALLARLTTTAADLLAAGATLLFIRR